MEFAPRSKQAIYELALLAILVTFLTVIAVRAFPLWDDAQTFLEGQRGGGRAVIRASLDRPVVGWIFALLVDSGRMVAVAAALYWLIWFGTGWVTLRLWKILFPARPGFAFAATCLTVAPLLDRLQAVLINPTLINMAGPLLVWLVLLRFLAPANDQRKTRQVLVLHVALAIVVVAGAMISEYVLPTSIAGAILLASLAPRPPARPWQVWITIGLLLISAAAGYAIYHRIADPNFRLDTRLEFQDWNWRIMVAGPRWLTAIWELTLGSLLERIAVLNFWAGKELVEGLVAGLILAGTVAWISRRYPNTSNDPNGSLNLRTMLTLALAIAAGILPVIAMGPKIHVWGGSRFFAPMLPVESCMAVALLAVLLRRRFWTMLPIGLAFVAGYYIVADGLLAVHERQQVEEFGDRLEPFIPDDGLTVAYIERNWKYPDRTAPEEFDLNARLTKNWPAKKREHFYAFAGTGPGAEESTASLTNKRISSLHDAFGPNPRLYQSWRHPAKTVDTGTSAHLADKSSEETEQNAEQGFDRVTQFIAVSEDSSGKLHVVRLPTCLNGSR